MDHQALVYLMRHKDTKSRLSRWGLILQIYDFQIECICGQSDAVADLLSLLDLNNLYVLMVKNEGFNRDSQK